MVLVLGVVGGLVVGVGGVCGGVGGVGGVLEGVGFCGVGVFVEVLLD